MPGLQLFNKMLPMQVSFSRGETVSPSKMNGIFNQLSSAFFMLESFLGNGTDYRIDDNSERKLLVNISSALGSTDKIYKPINTIPSLSRIAKKYATMTGAYDAVHDVLTITDWQSNTTIPVDAYANYEFGMLYKGRGIIKALDGNNATELTLPNNATWGWYKVSITSDISWFKLRAFNNTTALEIKSLYLVPKIDGMAYNKAYSIPIDNASYWVAKTPCIHSATGSAQECQVKTCDYCIGNTYGEDETNASTYGKPICSGAYYISAGQQVATSYAPEVTGIRKSYATVASPILTKSNNFAIKFKPFSMHNLPADTDIPQNYVLLYDAKNSASPVLYTVPLVSAGRGDIFYIKDTTQISSGVGDSNRYIVVGGDYGISNLLNDMLPNIELPLPMDSVEADVAIYSEV